MLRIFPYAGVQFLVFERAKHFYRERLGESHLVSFAAGSTAGVTAVSCTYPVDFLRARMAYTVGKDQAHSLRVTARHIYQTEGLASFYQGVYPTILGMVFYAGFSFGIYDYIKHTMLEYSSFQGSSDQHLNTVSNLVCGGLAGTISQTIAYPLDVVRRRMQLEHRPKGPEGYKYRGIAHTLRLLYAENGVRTLWRGVTLNYAREFPQVCVHVHTCIETRC
jgi:solute carrier family 25 protein 16